MDIVTHREMRNNSGAILRRVESGETVQVSNNGRVVALIIPAIGVTLSDLVARGEARPPRTGVDTLATIERRTSPRDSAALIDDIRGDW